MAKSNKNFKKPVNNQEIIIDEEEKNKKMIIMVVLSIIVVLGLIVGSITYFNGKDVKDDKKGNDKGKPTEIIKPVEDDKKPVVNETEKPIVTTPVVEKPKEDVAVTPTDPEEVTAVIESVDENDYEVTMDGNVIKVSGVSRFATITKDGKDINNAVVLRVVLDGKYSRNDLNNILVSTTFNGVTTNDTKEIGVIEEVTDPVTGVTTLVQYFDYVQPIGIGYDVPTAFTIKIGNDVKTYEVNLDDVKVETLVSTEEGKLFVTPYDNTTTAGAYDVEVYRKLSMDEIKLVNNPPVTASLADEEINNSNKANDAVDTGLNGSNVSDSNDKVEAPEPNYSNDLDYTIKFLTDGENVDYSKFNGTLVIKVYAPVITDESGNNTVTITKDNIKAEYIGTGKGSVTILEDTNQYLDSSNTQLNPNYGKFYVELSYDTTDDETLENQKFTIDWDGDGTNSGTSTYEFDLSNLRAEKEETQTPETTEINDENIDEEQEDGTLGDEQPKEVNNIDTPVQPEALDNLSIESQNQVDLGAEGTQN